MPDPVTLAETMTFVYGVARFMNHIPYFAELAAPMYDLWNETLMGGKRKTTQAASKFKLCDLPGWEGGAKEAFDKVKEAIDLVESLRTTFHDLNLKMCV